MNDGLRYLMGYHHALRIYRHDAAEGQPVLSRIQRADAIGKGMGQHRDYPVYQIHAGAPLKRLPVDCAVLLDIVGHICDMNPQDIVLPILNHGYCVIQILGILSVDRHHLPVPDILSPCPVGIGYVSGRTLRLV